MPKLVFAKALKSMFRGLVIGAFVIWILSIGWADSFHKNQDYSKIVYAEDGTILSLKVSTDGQWRFEPQHALPDNYVKALLIFEDKHFFNHPGIDLIGIARAAYLNLKHRHIVSGGSTITTQLARLLLHSRDRSIYTKLKEFVLAIGLETRYSKNKILNLYSQNAPMGSNVTGIEAAMFRYFNKSLKELSWAEAALLAVLPNQPSWMHIAKNRSKLLEKRNALLLRLLTSKLVDKDEFDLALLEPLPPKPEKINRNAPHLLDYLSSEYPAQSSFQTTIDARLQIRMNELCEIHNKILSQNDINNIALLLIDNHDQQVKAYVGNIIHDSLRMPNDEVNMIHANRSSGSILKPLLLSACLDAGIVSTQSLIPDVPIVINGFRPENFSRQYSGACTAAELIKYSLNIPSVVLLKDYGIPRFYSDLEKLGITSLFRKPMEYGLSLILGGAEVNMWDIGTTYAYLFYTMNNYNQFQHKYLPRNNFHLVILSKDSIHPSELKNEVQVFSAGSISKMFETMRNSIPSQNHGYSTEEKVRFAWKTGTSFGFKDAWCIGISPDYTVCVWVGNANGLSRPGLIGVESAAPVMFNAMSELAQPTEWTTPYDDLKEISVCHESGYSPGENCQTIDQIFTSSKAAPLKICPYHQSILVDESEKFRVNPNCEIKSKLKSYFVLPPLMAHYFKKHNFNYPEMPPERMDCLGTMTSSETEMDFIYPNSNTSVIVPIDLDEEKNTVILKAVHKNKRATIFWFLDDQFLEQTHENHEVKCRPGPGKHLLTISDESGNNRMIGFEVIR